MRFSICDLRFSIFDFRSSIFDLANQPIATSHSLRGIDHRPANCVVTDDPAAFARALESAAAGKIADVDGGVFRRRQIRTLDAAVARGLEALGMIRQEAA